MPCVAAPFLVRAGWSACCLDGWMQGLKTQPGEIFLHKDSEGLAFAPHPEETQCSKGLICQNNGLL